MKKTKVLITGATGILGNFLCRHLADNCNFLVFGTSRNKNLDFIGEDFFVGDLTDNQFINDVSKNAKPDVIIHCAANVNLDDCNTNKEYAYKLHVESTARLASYNRSTRFIYISTDSVFDGTRGWYSESDTPNPLNYYAQSKLGGESAALCNNINSLVIRTNIYGFHRPMGKSLVEWALENFAAYRTINGFTDVYFNPLYVGQLSKIIIELITIKTTGILNASSTEAISKYQFLERLADYFGYSNTLITKNVIDCSALAVTRPKNTTLDTSRLQRVIGQVTSINDGLEELKSDWDKSNIKFDQQRLRMAS